MKTVKVALVLKADAAKESRRIMLIAGRQMQVLVPSVVQLSESARCYNERN